MYEDTDWLPVYLSTREIDILDILFFNICICLVFTKDHSTLFSFYSATLCDNHAEGDH